MAKETQEQVAGEEPTKVQSLEGAMEEIATVIKAFSVTPQVVNVAFVQFKDAADQDILLAVSLFRVCKAPSINVTDSYGEQFAEAGRRFKIYVDAGAGLEGPAAEQAGVEALIKHMADQQAAMADETAEQSAEEGEPEGKTVSIG